MKTEASLRLPVWSLPIIMALLGAILSGVVYVVNTHSLAVGLDSRVKQLEDEEVRMKRVEDGVDQLWNREMDRGKGN